MCATGDHSCMGKKNEMCGKHKCSVQLMNRFHESLPLSCFWVFPSNPFYLFATCVSSCANDVFAKAERGRRGDAHETMPMDFDCGFCDGCLLSRLVHLRTGV